MDKFAAALMLTDDILETLLEVAATVQASIPDLCPNQEQVSPMQLGAFFASEAMIATIKKMKENAAYNFSKNSTQA
jgi:hypothetical protein